MSTTLITRDDYSRVAEFDALFIRATTRVNHYTYRFARRASAEGLVVIDDPHSIIRCSNKVFLAEGLARLKIPTPATLIVHKDNVDAIKKALKRAKNKDVTVKILPGLNHLFQECETGSPSEYANITQTFSPDVLRVLTDWILEQTR